MSEFVILLLAAAAVFALCFLGMGIGVLLRNRSFRSCGCAKITFRGHTIRCPGCTEQPGEAQDAEPHV